MEMTERQRKQVDEFVASLPAMTDAELTEATKQYIWLSAFANNNPRSAYHPMCDATADEWARRGNPDGYSRAHDAVVAANR